MNKIEKRYLTMMLLIRFKEIKAIVNDKNKKLEKEQLASLGGELALIDHILEELNEDDKDINIQS